MAPGLMNLFRFQGFAKQDHRKDLRRYLVFKYLQYLILPFPNVIINLLGLCASLYVTLLLRSPNISRKSTAVLIQNVAQADILVGFSMFAMIQDASQGERSSCSFHTALWQNFQTANAHVSSLLLSCVSLEAFLIAFLPAETRHIRTVRSAKMASKFIWISVSAECIVYQLEYLKDLNLISLGAPKHTLVLLSFCNGAAALMKSFIYPIGLLLRIINVFLFYKIFFSRSP
ncbi:lysophosphatidic acid receptor 6-like [Trichosurus vulpecula]|uniref:lysophosphatidic acid receptor 6-like n=1 Tax=Trichosurus vulpecula TaxID=9337 RepID=UPI00186ADEB5|nr:lysophosphatidic acid receptor 6-like [Trichosurus vulpecula]